MNLLSHHSIIESKSCFLDHRTSNTVIVYNKLNKPVTQAKKAKVRGSLTKDK